MNDLILCGFYSAGKSAVGQRCALQLKIPFHDTDSLLELKHQKKTRSLWEEFGEKAFRDFEEEIISSLSIEKQPRVISLGGGTLQSKKNCQVLMQMGNIVYLKASFETLLQRIEKRGFPAFCKTVEELKRIAEVRFPLYESLSSSIIETDHLNEQEVMNLVCASYGK